MKKRLSCSILAIILFMVHSMTILAAPSEIYKEMPDEAREAGITPEQYSAIMSMPDFIPESYALSNTANMRADQQAVVSMALSFQGVPYVWGGTSPAGFDCSGLVQYVYSHAVGIYLPRVTTQQETQGREVSLSSLLPGDLLFYGTRGQTTHVAIYIGDNKFIHAPKPNDVVRVTGINQYRPSFARRILPDTIAATSVTLNKYSLGLFVGESETLSAIVNPSNASDKSIIWSTSNSAVASVDSNGRVTAKSVGSATITAQNNASNKTSSCTVYISGDVSEFINRLFSEALGRTPDTTGLNNFKNVIKNNSACKAIEDIFNNSEYRGKNYSNDQFVTMAYKAILGRSPDTSGKNNMIKLLATGMSRTYILYQISASEEFSKYCSGISMRRGVINLTENRDQNEKYTQFVNHIYLNALGRKGDQSGLNTFTGILLSGGTGAHIIQEIFESSEYINKNKSNSQYIDDLYMAALQRNAGNSGKQAWLNQLNSGISRRDVMKGIINSQEFKNICAKYVVTPGEL